MEKSCIQFKAYYLEFTDACFSHYVVWVCLEKDPPQVYQHVDLYAFYGQLSVLNYEWCNIGQWCNGCL